MKGRQRGREKKKKKHLLVQGKLGRNGGKLRKKECETGKRRRNR